jgi:hypothetical protein
MQKTEELLKLYDQLAGPQITSEWEAELFQKIEINKASKLSNWQLLNVSGIVLLVLLNLFAIASDRLSFRDKKMKEDLRHMANELLVVTGSSNF